MASCSAIFTSVCARRSCCSAICLFDRCAIFLSDLQAGQIQSTNFDVVNQEFLCNGAFHQCRDVIPFRGNGDKLILRKDGLESLQQRWLDDARVNIAVIAGDGSINPTASSGRTAYLTVAASMTCRSLVSVANSSGLTCVRTSKG